MGIVGSRNQLNIRYDPGTIGAAVSIAISIFREFEGYSCGFYSKVRLF